jgi:hypothetical protein
VALINGVDVIPPEGAPNRGVAAAGRQHPDLRGWSAGAISQRLVFPSSVEGFVSFQMSRNPQPGSAFPSSMGLYYRPADQVEYKGLALFVFDAGNSPSALWEPAALARCYSAVA